MLGEECPHLAVPSADGIPTDLELVLVAADVCDVPLQGASLARGDSERGDKRNTHHAAAVHGDVGSEGEDAFGPERPVLSDFPPDDIVARLADDVVVSVWEAHGRADKRNDG